MKKLEEISNCQKFQAYKDNTLLKIVDHCLFVGKVEFLGKYYNFSLIGNQVWTWDNNSSRTRVFDIFKKKQLFESETFIYPAPFPDVPNKKNVFNGFCRLTKNKESILLNYDTFLIEEKYPLQYGLNGIWFFINETSFVSLNSNFITLHTLNTEKVIWIKSFADLLQSDSAKKYGDIIEHKDKLYFYLSDGTKSGIYAIDVHSGELVNHTNEVGSFMKLANDKLYMFYDNELVILNPNSFKIEKIDYSGILKPENLRINCIVPSFKGIVFKSNLLYFVSLNHGEKDNSREVAVGIIDMNEHKLIEVIRFPTTTGSYNINEIQVHENQLFVLTNDSVLHIFEN